MKPYVLNVNTVNSGFKAIDKVKEGSEFDIIFMDHMMPKMDGIEATKIIRDMGYTGTIVALTANALIGQMDIFLENGFDDFITKPVDVRYLNVVLKKYIQDKQPEEVLEEVRKNMLYSKRNIGLEPGQINVSPKLAEFFILDAEKAVNDLEAFSNKDSNYEDEDVKAYTVTVHAMKTALLNVGEKDLSEFAGMLERAGWKDDREAMKETPVFVERLKLVIKKFSPQENEDKEITVTNDDYADLKEKMLVIIEANESYDNKTAKDLINDLREKSWPGLMTKLLSEMSEQLLSGDIDGVTQTAGSIKEECDKKLD